MEDIHQEDVLYNLLRKYSLNFPTREDWSTSDNLTRKIRHVACVLACVFDEKFSLE